MIRSYKTVLSQAEAEITEKKSRFIARVSPIETEDDALAFIDVIRKKHYNANHNCYAYTLGGKQRYSDDGEPAQTAGMPILNVITGHGLTNCIVVVTRYFGGALLGTGGLVRAYSSAAKAALQSAGVIEKILVNIVSVKTDYSQSGRVQYNILDSGHIIWETVYTDTVEFIVLVGVDLYDGFVENINEATGATAKIEIIETVYYAMVGGKPEIFREAK